MKMSPAGRAFLTVWEGVQLRAYRCAANVLTIGVGHALTVTERQTGILDIDGIGIAWRRGLSRDQADLLLTQDLVRFERAVDSIEVKLEQHQFDALASFAFNVGVSAFSESTMVKHLRRHDYASVPSQMKRWCKGKVNDKMVSVDGLKKRREAEGQLFMMGDYTGLP